MSEPKRILIVGAERGLGLGLADQFLRRGWAVAMGTLDGTVSAEIDVNTSVHGVADVVERHIGCGKQLYLDYRDNPLDW